MIKNNKKIGGHLLADQLSANGVDTIFCVPGESYLGLMDGLYMSENEKLSKKLIIKKCLSQWQSTLQRLITPIGFQNL